MIVYFAFLLLRNNLGSISLTSAISLALATKSSSTFGAMVALDGSLNLQITVRRKPGPGLKSKKLCEPQRTFFQLGQTKISLVLLATALLWM
jgi:hypothetical protein